MKDSPPPGGRDPEDMEKLLNRYLEELSRLDLEPPVSSKPPDMPGPVPGPADAPRPGEFADLVSAAAQAGSPAALLSDFRARLQTETRALRAEPEVPSVREPPEDQGSGGGSSPEPGPPALGLLQGLLSPVRSTFKAMTSVREAGGPAVAAPYGAAPGRLEEKMRVLAERQFLLQRAHEDLRGQIFSLADKFRKLRDITQALIEVARNRRSG